MTEKFVLFTGGTGGHVLPSISFGNYLIHNGYQCIIITDKRGNRYTKKFLGKVKIIKASHLTGNFFFKVLGSFKLFFGLIQSMILLIRIKPKIAISFGSYASLPPSLVIKIIKKLYKIKFYIHEQNSSFGKVNKYLLKEANKIFVNFSKNYNLPIELRKKLYIVGLPTLNNIHNDHDLIKLKIAKKRFTFFLGGGSQGSIPIINCFEKILLNFSSIELDDIFFIIQCPKEYYKELEVKISKFNINCLIEEFFNNLPSILNKTDFIISRCGAGAINDIITYQIPSILIPLPSAIENHQFENANIITEIECGIILDQNDFDANKASNFIKGILKDLNKKNHIKNKLKQKNIKDTNKLMLNLINEEQ